MNAAEMKELLLLKFDGLFESSAPAYSDNQLSAVLNNAQRRILRDVDSADPKKRYGGFDYNERVSKYIAPLISGDTPDVVAAYVPLYPLGVGYELPVDCWYLRSERALIGTTGVKVKRVTHDSYNANIDNPYKRPSSEEIWRLDAGETGGQTIVELIPPEGSSIAEYSIVYTKELQPINLGLSVPCILHEDLHDDVVDEAFQIMTGAANPELYNIANNEANNN